MEKQHLVNIIKKKLKKHPIVFVLIKEKLFCNRDIILSIEENFNQNFLIIPMINYLKNSSYPYHKDSYFFDQLLSNIESLKNGQSVEIPFFNYHESRRIGSSISHPKQVIVIHGLFLKTVKETIPKDQLIFIKSK